MNKVVTSKEELLDTARQIVFQEGIDQLSIRALAKKLNISVGAVYNYFPSKSDLLLAIVESFWKGIFHKDICILSETLPFADFYEVVYHRLAEHMEDFFSVLLGQLDILRNTEKERGKLMEERYQQHIREGFLYALQQDCNIPAHIWNATFTKAAFIDFLMEHMMNDLSHQRRSCTFTKELICRLLQVTHETTTHGPK